MPNKKPISFDNGVVDEGTTNPTLTPSGTPIVINVAGDNGPPIPGANVTLICGKPPRSVRGIDQGDGTFKFEDAASASGTEECEIVVEAPG